MLFTSENFTHNGACGKNASRAASGPRRWSHIVLLLLLSACDDDATQGGDSSIPPFQTVDANLQTGTNDAGGPMGPGSGIAGGGLDAGMFDGGGSTPGNVNDTGLSPPSNVEAGSAQPRGDGGDPGGPVVVGSCTRDGLRALVEQYFKAFAAHDPSMLPLASNAKYTENGKMVAVGEGAWKTAGALKFKRTLVDTQVCTAVVEAVFDNAYSGGGGSGLLGGLFGGGGGGGGGSSDAGAGRADFVYGLRLKLDADKITEIETILVSPAGWVPNAQGVIGSAKEDWETPLPVDKRPTRDELKKLVDDYFDLFETGDVASYPFATNCARMENGTSPGPCDFGITAFGGMTPRLYVLDVESGVAIGFVMFAGSFTDFHMLKLRDKQVDGVRAVLASASSSGWN